MKKILELLLKHYENPKTRTIMKHRGHYGLCDVVNYLCCEPNPSLTWIDKQTFKTYINNDRINQKIFYKFTNLFSMTDDTTRKSSSRNQYVWPLTHIAPRIAWLKKHIKKLS